MSQVDVHVFYNDFISLSLCHKIRVSCTEDIHYSKTL